MVWWLADVDSEYLNTRRASLRSGNEFYHIYISQSNNSLYVTFFVIGSV
jgi:hypothetical protein